MIRFKIVLLLLTGFSGVFNNQNNYKIVIENITVDFVDRKYMDAAACVVKLGNDNAINLAFKLKFDTPDDAQMIIDGFRWIKTGYRLRAFHIQKSLKLFLQMSMFGFQNLFEEIIRPPLVWPIEKGITYRITGFFVDSTKFPPNLPPGKWKIEISEEFVTKERLIAYSIYFNLKYNH